MTTPEPREPGYEEGYRDGENNVAVDWRIAWEEYGPEGEVPSFREAAERLAAAGDDLTAERAEWYRKGWKAALREAGGVLDRDQARAVLLGGWLDGNDRDDVDTLLDQLAGCVVRPAAIDRDRLIDYFDTIWPGGKEEMADHVLSMMQQQKGKA